LHEYGYLANVVDVASLEEASRRVVAFQDEHGLGSSKLGERHGLVSYDGKPTHRIAYNGSVWPAEPNTLEAELRPSKVLVTTIRSEVIGAHAHVKVWVRGGLAGELVVDAGDGPRIASRLLPDDPDVSERFDASGAYTRTVRL
jgi:hypothetical protein